MSLESKIPGIGAIVSIEDEQERLHAIGQFFDSSDSGSQLIDTLLQELPKEAFVIVPIVTAEPEPITTGSAQVSGRSGSIWPFRR